MSAARQIRFDAMRASLVDRGLLARAGREYTLTVAGYAETERILRDIAELPPLERRREKSVTWWMPKLDR